jgi:hypothetical protein
MASSSQSIGESSPSHRTPQCVTSLEDLPLTGELVELEVRHLHLGVHSLPDGEVTEIQVGAGGGAGGFGSVSRATGDDPCPFVFSNRFDHLCQRRGVESEGEHLAGQQEVLPGLPVFAEPRPGCYDVDHGTTSPALDIPPGEYIDGEPGTGRKTRTVTRRSEQ